mmetsp:Transcript_67213/g.161042  ORF Transcript_67213/g.161042 Transcript_67213/m.161042 type:complete len:292 (+) Transcript_67213:80-955(+)
MRRIKNLFFGGGTAASAPSADAKKGSPAEDPKASAAEPAAQEAALTWAVKTEASRGNAIGSTSQAKRTPGSDRPAQQQQFGSAPRQDNQRKPAQQSQQFVLQDAEEDDEIEIIYEAKAQKAHDAKRSNSPTHQMLQSAANGQEAPEVEEKHAVQQPAAPLSKQQKEEAARLAESRKRFENQRVAAQPLQNDGPIGTTVRQGGTSPQRNPAPHAEMVLGLNRDAERDNNRYNELQVTGAGFLPGGVCDDELEAMMLPPSHKPKRTAQDDAKEPGFDADDERLMKEILDNFET